MKGKAKALESDTCEEYRDALAAFRTLEVAEREHRDHTMLRVLLELYGERYARAQARALGARLRGPRAARARPARRDAGLREAYASRFEHVLVDEFQDTNPLQNELLEPARARQPVPRRRREPVDLRLPQRRRRACSASTASEAAAAGRAESITVNFRTRGEVLDAIDLAFERAWGRASSRCARRPGAREPARGRRAVRGAARGATEREALGGGARRRATRSARACTARPPWRAAEARLLAKRIDELAAAGRCALRRRGGAAARHHRTWASTSARSRSAASPRYVVGGRGYWGQQQVADLRHWLAALANPLDELALYSRARLAARAGSSLDARGADRRCDGARGRAGATRGGCCESPDRRARSALPAGADRARLGAFVEPLRGRAPRRRRGCRSRR